jgi:hypothetical protein
MKKVDCICLHLHWRNSPFWTIALLRRFCQIWYSFHFFWFRKNNFSTEQGRQPCVQHPTWRTRSFYLGPPVTGWPSYTPGIGFPFRRLLRLAGLVFQLTSTLESRLIEHVKCGSISILGRFCLSVDVRISFEQKDSIENKHSIGLQASSLHNTCTNRHVCLIAPRNDFTFLNIYFVEACLNA